MKIINIEGTIYLIKPFKNGCLKLVPCENVSSAPVDLSKYTADELYQAWIDKEETVTDPMIYDAEQNQWNTI